MLRADACCWLVALRQLSRSYAKWRSRESTVDRRDIGEDVVSGLSLASPPSSLSLGSCDAPMFREMHVLLCKVDSARGGVVTNLKPLQILRFLVPRIANLKIFGTKILRFAISRFARNQFRDNVSQKLQ